MVQFESISKQAVIRGKDWKKARTTNIGKGPKKSSSALNFRFKEKNNKRVNT